MFVDGAGSQAEYAEALKVVLEKQAKREEKKNKPTTPNAPKKKRTNSTKSDATTPYKAPQSGDQNEMEQ